MLNKYGGFLLHSTKLVTRLWTGVTVVSRRVPSEVPIAFLTSGAASSAAGHCPFPGAAVSELRRGSSLLCRELQGNCRVLTLMGFLVLKYPLPETSEDYCSQLLS